ncbi:MAG: ABC transporter substrate-binding protein [Reyranellaceae bacterium]
MPGHDRITRRRLGKAGLAGIALLSAPLPLRHGWAQASAGLKVALLLPTTGAQAQGGQACRRGAEIANDIFADMKMGVRLDISHYDTGDRLELARAQAEKAIEAGAHMLVGAFGSEQTLAIAQVAEQRGIPLVVNIAAAPQLTEQGYKSVVRNFPTTAMLIDGALALHKEAFKASGETPKTAVLIHIDDAFGAAMASGIKASLPKLDMPYELLDIIPYNAGAKDLSGEVAKAKATKAELLLPVCRPADARLLVQEMVKQRWEPMGIMSPGAPGLYEPGFLKAVGKHGDFLISNVPWLDPRLDMTKALAKRHIAKFPNDPLDLNGGFGFEGMLIAAHAWLAAKSTRPEALMEALRGIRIDRHVMIGGPIQFDAKGQNIDIKTAAVQNLKRKPTVVLPLNSATAPLTFPMPGWADKRRT